jgi:arylsulfatase A-like enzyme
MCEPQGYATGQFGKNHLGDCNATVHGFDEFFGNLYHLNAERSRKTRPRPTPASTTSGASSALADLNRELCRGKSRSLMLI